MNYPTPDLLEEVLRAVLVPRHQDDIESRRAYKAAVGLLHSEICDGMPRARVDELEHRESALERFEFGVLHAQTFEELARSREAEELEWIERQWSEHFEKLGI